MRVVPFKPEAGQGGGYKRVRGAPRPKPLCVYSPYSKLRGEWGRVCAVRILLRESLLSATFITNTDRSGEAVAPQGALPPLRPILGFFHASRTYSPTADR